jgi:hypothetical protein
MIKQVAGLYFNPDGGVDEITEKISFEISRRLSEAYGYEIPFSLVDVLDNTIAEDFDFTDETVVVLGMPSHFGKLPLGAIKTIRKINGNNALAIAAIGYGSSHYGNSLYELYNYAEDQDLSIVGAGAFVIKGRGIRFIGTRKPTEEDLEELLRFCEVCSGKIRRLSGTDISRMRVKPVPLDIKRTSPLSKTVLGVRHLVRRKTEWFV